jgi:hypothetical protein
MNRAFALILASALILGSFAFAIWLAGQFVDSREMNVLVGFLIWLPLFWFIKKAFDGVRGWKG